MDAGGIDTIHRKLWLKTKYNEGREFRNFQRRKMKTYRTNQNIIFLSNTTYDNIKNGKKNVENLRMTKTSQIFVKFFTAKNAVIFGYQGFLKNGFVSKNLKISPKNVVTRYPKRIY